jgi:hypothetical protein
MACSSRVMIDGLLSTMSLWGPALIEQLAGQHQLITDSPSDIIEPPENSLIIANRIPFSWLAFFEGDTFLCFSRSRHSPTPERGPAVAQTLQPMIRRIDGQPLHGRHRHRAG